MELSTECGSGGDCETADSDLHIGPNGNSYQELASDGVIGCQKTCEASKECAGFSLDHFERTCYFRRSTSCHKREYDYYDCYKIDRDGHHSGTHTKTFLLRSVVFG